MIVEIRKGSQQWRQQKGKPKALPGKPPKTWGLIRQGGRRNVSTSLAEMGKSNKGMWGFR